MFESCVEIRKHFSDYLDGLCEPDVLRSLRYHLSYCGSCQEELDQWLSLQSDLRGLARRRVPPELSLRLRVRLSQQLHQKMLGRLWVRLENVLKPFLVPASGGVLAAVVCFGLMLGWQVVPVTNAPDVPLQLLGRPPAPDLSLTTPLPRVAPPQQLVTPARLREFGPIDLDTAEKSVVVLTRIDAVGRVQGYRVLSGQSSPELMERLDRMIYFSVFQPATAFGRPTDGEVVLSLRRITVRG